MNSFTYYATPSLFGKSGFELRQTRFIGHEDHPHDVCAMAFSVSELRETVKILGGSIDWSRVEGKSVQIKDAYPLATYRGLRGTIKRLVPFNKAYVDLNSYPGISVKTLLIDRDYLEVLP